MMRDRPFLMRSHVERGVDALVGLTSTGYDGVDRVALSVVAEAILAQRAGQLTSYSRNRSSYTGLTQYGGRDFTYANVMRAVDHVAGLGLLELHPGFWRSDGSGRQSTFAATAELAALGDVVPRILVRSPTNLIMKDGAKRLIPYRLTRDARRMMSDLSGWTESVKGSEIRVEAPDIDWSENGLVSVPHRTNDGDPITIKITTGDFVFYRVFNNASFAQGGRAYGHWSQSLPKARRAQITIDAEPVALLDFSASHPRMLYAQASIPLEGDPYELPGFERDIAKVGLLVVLNAISRQQGVEAMAHKLAEAKVTGRDRATAAALLSALEERHKPIQDHFYRSTGLTCQRTKAVILADVARQARREGIVTLPVHDEIIAKARHESRIIELMNDAWRMRTGADPVIKRG
ncbi:hypothetical protein LNAOJCKE_1590 [Methylorubrum aminovorans]|uniref:Uncharacterized protein n=2 Tax=Methylorubrum aminovorans TaxID=269069 RepID=A0ABQ4UCC6_9HYPH|nr:hypothetical protein LNAOJCKE_1590 [Methylorubrum aminovorans]